MFLNRMASYLEVNILWQLAPVSLVQPALNVIMLCACCWHFTDTHYHDAYSPGSSVTSCQVLAPTRSPMWPKVPHHLNVLCPNGVANTCGAHGYFHQDPKDAIFNAATHRWQRELSLHGIVSQPFYIGHSGDESTSKFTDAWAFDPLWVSVLWISGTSCDLVHAFKDSSWIYYAVYDIIWHDRLSQCWLVMLNEE